MKTIELDIELVRKIKIELYSSYEQLLDVEENKWAENVRKLVEVLEQKIEAQDSE